MKLRKVNENKELDLMSEKTKTWPKAEKEI